MTELSVTNTKPDVVAGATGEAKTATLTVTLAAIISLADILYRHKVGLVLEDRITKNGEVVEN